MNQPDTAAPPRKPDRLDLDAPAAEAVAPLAVALHRAAVARRRALIAARNSARLALAELDKGAAALETADTLAGFLDLDAAGAPDTASPAAVAYALDTFNRRGRDAMNAAASSMRRSLADLEAEALDRLDVAAVKAEAEADEEASDLARARRLAADLEAGHTAEATAPAKPADLAKARDQLARDRARDSRPTKAAPRLHRTLGREGSNLHSDI